MIGLQPGGAAVRPGGGFASVDTQTEAVPARLQTRELAGDLSPIQCLVKQHTILHADRIILRLHQKSRRRLGRHLLVVRVPSH